MQLLHGPKSSTTESPGKSRTARGALGLLAGSKLLPWYSCNSYAEGSLRGRGNGEGAQCPYPPTSCSVQERKPKVWAQLFRQCLKSRTQAWPRARQTVSHTVNSSSSLGEEPGRVGKEPRNPLSGVSPEGARVGRTSFPHGPQRSKERGRKGSSARIHLNFLLFISEIIALSGFLLINNKQTYPPYSTAKLKWRDRLSWPRGKSNLRATPRLISVSWVKFAILEATAARGASQTFRICLKLDKLGPILFGSSHRPTSDCSSHHGERELSAGHELW